VHLLDREVAGEHAAGWAEGLDHLQHERPQALDGPGPVDHRQARDLATDVRPFGQQGQTLPPDLQAGVVAIGRHAGVIDDHRDVRVGCGQSISKLNWGKELVAAIESNVLKHLPGYEYTKATAQDIFGITEHGFQDVVLYRDDEGKYAIAFKVESITVTMIMIFIPSVPKPRDGEMLIVDIDRLTHTELTTHQAFGIMKSIGTGSAGLLSKYFDGGIAKEINELKN
jgi:hypothetical protein